jgi:hypothetical protein
MNEYLEAGFDEVYIHRVGGDLSGFLGFREKEPRADSTVGPPSVYVELTCFWGTASVTLKRSPVGKMGCALKEKGMHEYLGNVAA